MTLRRLLLIALAASASASHQTTPHLAVSRLRGGAGASSVRGAQFGAILTAIQFSLAHASIPTQAPAALTKPRSKLPLSLVADAAAKFTLPKEAEIAIGAAGIFLSYSVLAVQQENVYKRAYGGEYFKYTFLVLVMERLINAAVALVGLLSFGPSGLKIPHLDIFNSGVSQMLAMASSNEALRYVSYPTQVLGKSCKMVPVMAAASSSAASASRSSSTCRWR